MNCEVCRSPMRKLELFTSVVDHCDYCEDNKGSAVRQTTCWPTFNRIIWDTCGYTSKFSESKLGMPFPENKGHTVVAINEDEVMVELDGPYPAYLKWFDGEVWYLLKKRAEQEEIPF